MISMPVRHVLVKLAFWPDFVNFPKARTDHGFYKTGCPWLFWAKFLLDIRHMSEKNVEEARGGTSIFVRLERAQSAGETRAIIGEIIKKCAGAKYDRFRRLLRNYIMCGLERGSWTDDLDKPMPLEDFDMIYDNYPEWATVDKENGLKEGLRKGKREGTQESRATIIGELLAAFKEKLSERFGKLPQSWVDNLAKVADPARIIDLTGAIYKVNSPEEFEARLMEMTR